METALNKKNNRGFTAIEILLVVVIMTILSTIVISTFISFRKNQSLQRDTELIVETLNQARNQTISSKNLVEYGVHFASTSITIFTGATYSAGASGNQVYNLNPADTIITLGLNGGGSSVVFKRLTGETSQNGTVVVSSSGLSQTKTVTIYGTGVIESD